MTPNPAQCPPLTQSIILEYTEVMQAEMAPELRAWIREVSKVCRANATLRKETKY